MQSAKESNYFKFESFEVWLTAFTDKKLQLKVVDPHERMQFHEKLLTLTNIGTTTLMKALGRKTLEIKIGMKVNKTVENAILQIDVLVASQFLKPVQETIYIKKSRDISESELLKNSINTITSKIKTIKQNDKNNPNIVRCGTNQQDEKLYNSGVNYEQIAVIKLPKGKYVMTLSFLAKPTNSWMYVYFQQGQQVIQNCGFYLPTSTQYNPIIIRKTHSVISEEENVQFTTYYGQSYPVSLKNVILTAQPIS